MFERLGKCCGLFGIMLVFVASASLAGGHPNQELRIQNAKYSAQKDELFIKVKVGKDLGAGQIELRDSLLGTLLASEYTSGKSHIFRLGPIWDISIPCQVEVVMGGSSASSPVKHAPDNCSQYGVTLSGVVDPLLPLATVEVALSATTFTTNADENGEYALEISTGTPEELVIVEVSGASPSTGAPVDLISMPGTVTGVMENPNANVTNMSTASFALVVAANSGIVPSTLAELKAAETHVESDELFELAVAVKLIAEDPRFPLPTDFHSVVEFAGDSAAVDAFIEEVANQDPNALSEAQADILADPDLVPGFENSDIPPQYYVIPVAVPNYMAREGAVLEFEAANATGERYSFVEWYGDYFNESFAWTITDGDLVIDYDSPRSVEMIARAIEELTDDPALIDAYNAGGGTPGGIIRYYESVSQTTHTRIAEGLLVDMISTEQRLIINVPPFQLRDGSTLDLGPDQIWFRTIFETFRSSENIEAIPFTTTCEVGDVCAPGVWGGMLHYAAGIRFYDEFVYPDTAYAELITLNSDHTASGQVSGVTPDWTIGSAGELILTYPDGLVQTVSFIDNLGPLYGGLCVYDDGTERYMSYGWWVKQDPAFVFTASFLMPSQENRYWNGDINHWKPEYWDDNGNRFLGDTFGWKFYPDAGVYNHYIDDFTDQDGDGNPDITLIFRDSMGFEIDGPNVTINRYSYARRFWFPLAEFTIGGDRAFYALEVEERNAFLQYGGPDFWGLLFPARLNLEREIEDPETIYTEYIPAR